MRHSPYMAVHRFGLGAQASEIRTIQSNPLLWLEAQLDKTADIKGRFSNSEDLGKRVAEIRSARGDERKRYVRAGVTLYKSELEARFDNAIQTDNPFLEKMVHFWSNHFTVSSKGKNHIMVLLPAFEREAIRPYITGKFSDMLLASSQHIAMLLYLDNASSLGPHSQVGKRRDRGLNENLAREILELHTLGVDGGYTQEDVISLAKIITGWTTQPFNKGGGGFLFRDIMHEPGVQTLLGKKYPQKGVQQGIAALRDIATHPSTARFVARKLATHFISDAPAQSSITQLENTFLESGGDLKALYRTLLAMPECWDSATMKVKNPYELLVSSFRSVGVGLNKIPYAQVDKSLRQMEHSPFQALSPAGWPDSQDDWLSPNATMNRVELCYAFAQQLRPFENPVDIADGIMGPLLSKNTRKWLALAPSPKDGLALLLASPEWQRR